MFVMCHLPHMKIILVGTLLGGSMGPSKEAVEGRMEQSVLAHNEDINKGT